MNKIKVLILLSKISICLLTLQLLGMISIILGFLFVGEVFTNLFIVEASFTQENPNYVFLIVNSIFLCAFSLLLIHLRKIDPVDECRS
ncbi:MAG: hypothetical protein JJU29_20575 [Verrucomicrobia bacterium]|nr:hypothetical protein [Verrucomicrobiota bacterium]MCH8512676.1 hypothetical protein [Kiritimatiellia bacterium]